jgi:hypothetical protein
LLFPGQYWWQRASIGHARGYGDATAYEHAGTHAGTFAVPGAMWDLGTFVD